MGTLCGIPIQRVLKFSVNDLLNWAKYAFFAIVINSLMRTMLEISTLVHLDFRFKKLRNSYTEST